MLNIKVLLPHDMWPQLYFGYNVLVPLVLFLPNTFLDFQSFNYFERKWWMLTQNAVCTKFDIYVFVNENTLFCLQGNVMMLLAN